MATDKRFNYGEELVRGWNQRIKTLRWLGFALGLILIFFGLTCFVYPTDFARTIAHIVAFFVVLSGLYRLVDYFATPVLLRVGSKLVSGIFSLAIGYLMFTMPFDSMVRIISILIAIDLAITGIEKILFAAKLRIFEARGYSWLVADAVFNLVAAAFFAFVPNWVSLALSVLVGFFVVVAGTSILLESINAREYEIREPRRLRRMRVRQEDVKEAEIVKDK